MKLKSVPLFLLALSLVYACSAAGTSRVFQGYVQSSATDENDNPTEIYLFDGKEEYQVEKGKIRNELLELVDRKISAKVVISEGWGGKKTALVEQYKVIE